MSSLIMFWILSIFFEWSIAGRTLVFDLVRRYGANRVVVELSFVLLNVEARELDVEYRVSRSIGTSGVSESIFAMRSLFLIVSG